MAPVANSAIATTPPMVPPTMAATGVGLLVLVLDGLGVEEPVVVGDVIAKDSIVDRLASL